VSDTIQSIRGMHDLLPTDSYRWQNLENTLKKLANRLNYKEIRTPILESLSLFQRSIGEETDVVGKEMYHFADRNGDQLALRPEGTASCVRAMLQHGQLRTPGQKIWYLGPMFRHERPQRGRTRQFHHFGLEAYGIDNTSIECEMLAYCYHIWQQLGVDHTVTLTLNTLGTTACRARYKAALVRYFNTHQSQLNEAEQARLVNNPLRLLDSKNPVIRALLPAAPQLHDYLDPQEQLRFQALCDALTQLGIPYQVDPYLVRGLDYYNGMVFEWVTEALGAQGTICAGGRYDQLVSQLGNQAVPAVGFAMGLERIIELMPTTPPPQPDVYLIALDPECQASMSSVAQTLLHHTTLSVVQDHLGGSAKSQFKRAAQSHAALALIMGPEECASGHILVKSLAQQTQTPIAQSELLSHLATYFGAPHDH
jgi:histidyl-tRNA synthetase